MPVGTQYKQLAWVVDDLEKAVRHWQETTRIGPFFVGEHVGGMLAGGLYRGQPMDVDMSSAVAQAGGVQIELIQQHGSAPSPYREVYPEGTGGFHHVCTLVDDVDAEVRHYEKNGFEVVMTALLGGQTPVAYVDTRPLLGCMTELMGRQGIVAQMFGAVEAAAEGWDGTDPIRDIASLMS